MDKTSKVALGFIYVPYINKERRHAQHLSIQTMNIEQGIYPIALDFKGTSSQIDEWPNIPKLNLLKRNSKDTIKNTRDLPYIKDIFDILARVNCDIIGYTNSDIAFWSYARKILNIGDTESFLFSRKDIPLLKNIDQGLDPKEIEKNHSGMDACFFRRDWWIKNRNLFPNDLIVGETEWDTVYRTIAKKNSTYIESRAIFHFKHAPQWNVTSPGAINNIKIFNQMR